MNAIKYAKYFFLSLCLLTCANDYSVINNPEMEVIDEGPVTEVIVDYFVQPEPPENLDVLVVLDTSCSMSDNYENVSAGLDILRGDIEAITDDYQMGMINSSLVEQYFEGPIDSTTSSMEIFLAPYALGSDRVEEVFMSLYRFTETEIGQEFLRPDVDKLYIFVSDEPEQSTMPVSLFKDWMTEYHEDVNHDIVVIGINDQSDCDTYYQLDPNAEDRYLSFATYYNKMIIDICGDFQLALADNSFIVNRATYMQLSRTPIEDSIVVYQDGVKEEMWYYLPETNTVYFEFELYDGAVTKVGYDSEVIE
jgi:hypothetical protein